jgi:hypothetical protein
VNLKRITRSLAVTLAVMALATACNQVASLVSASLEQVDTKTVKVTANTSGNLTIASTEIITFQSSVKDCKIIDTFKGKDHGVLCPKITTGFTVNVETVGTIFARVTPLTQELPKL